DHITTLGLVREAEIANALTRVIPNVRGVHVPLSGTSSFTAYVSIAQSRPGEAKHLIPIVLGVDHYLKLVVVVDDDIDVFDEAEVLWAVATRMQADRDLVVISGSLGAMLDPSADDRGVTAKLGIDATRPFGEPFAEISLDQVMGEALVVDLSFAGANHAITIDDLKRGGADDVKQGDIVLLRTGWTDTMYGRWPDYFTQSPYFPPATAEWLVARGPKNIGFDFFEEYCARLPDFSSEDFSMHRVILGAGVVIMEGLTNLV